MALNIALIRESFAAIKPHTGPFFQTFYENLFNKYPEAKVLFAGVNLKQQERALAASFSHIVDYLDDQEHLVDYLRKMGGRHAGYNVVDAHYKIVGETLLATFAFYFDEQWTSELKAAWTEAFGFIASEMKEGMAAARRGTKAVPAEHLTAATHEPSLEAAARQYATQLLKKVLEEEAAKILPGLAKEKVQEILRLSLESEAKAAINSFGKRAA